MKLRRQNFCPCRDGVRRKGLTLLELLVVIGCAAVILAFIFPISRTVLEKSHLAKSLANVRQIGQAARLFIAENNGFLPRADGRDSDIGPDWPTALRPYGAGVRIPEPGYAPNSLHINPAGWSHEFPPDSLKYSYAMNGNLQKMPPPPKGEVIGPVIPIHVTSITNATEMVFFADTAVAGRAMNYQHVAYRCLNNTVATVLFVDGHAEGRTKENLSFERNFYYPQ